MIVDFEMVDGWEEGLCHAGERGYGSSAITENMQSIMTS